MRTLPLAFLVLFLAGCGGGGYLSATSGARSDFYSGAFSESAAKLEKSAHTEGKDQLLYLLDRATALHQAGAYEDSNADFLKADKLAEINDYTSLAAGATSIVASEEVGHYKGDEFEYVLISQYLAINYLMLGKLEDALVECRRVNQKLYRLVFEGKRHYNQNAMAKYLSAVIFETNGDWDDSYIDYQAVRGLSPGMPNLSEDLYRLAWRTKNREDMSKWISEYSISDEDAKRIRDTASNPEAVVIVANGRAPRKEPNPQWEALPMFVSKDNPTDHVSVSLEGEAPLVAHGDARSYALYDVDSVAKQNLDEKYGPLLAKKIAGLVVKGAVAYEVGRNTDPMLGYLLFRALNAADTADTRSWQTLPKDFQIARVRLPKGTGSYKLRISPQTQSGSSSGSASTIVEKIVTVQGDKPGSKLFVPVRTY